MLRFYIRSTSEGSMKHSLHEVLLNRRDTRIRGQAMHSKSESSCSLFIDGLPAFATLSTTTFLSPRRRRGIDDVQRALRERQVKRLVTTVAIDAVDDLRRSLKGLRTENPVNLRTDPGVGVKKVGPSFRELLSAAQLGSIARGRPKGVGGTEAVLECQGNKSFRAFAIARAHTLAGVDEEVQPHDPAHSD